ERAGASEPSRQLLFRLFSLTFDYWKLKGVVAATATDESPAPTSVEPMSGDHPKRVLLVAPDLPAWDRASGSVRLFQIVKLLREQGHHVTFLARAAAGEHDPTPYVQALAALGVEVIPVDPDRIREKWGAEVDAPRLDLRELLTGRRWDVAYLYFYELA